jgi:non-canonical poly(A) RNA polymerase PAPD5/7
MHHHEQTTPQKQQDIARELPALTVLGDVGGGGGAAGAAAAAQAPPAAANAGDGALQVFDSDDDGEEDGEQDRPKQQQQQEQQPDRRRRTASAPLARKRPRASEEEEEEEDDDDDEDAATSSSSDEEDPEHQQQLEFISLGVAAEREALLERQAAEEARRAADEARRAAVEGRAFGFRPPWLLPAAPGAPHTLPRSRTLRLHNELVAFAKMLEPTPAEAAARAESVARVREAVASVFPSARLLVFGSYATGLYVPTSDIDVVVVGSGAGRDVPSALRAVAAQLQRRGLVRPGTLTVIAKARVPIVKFEMAGSGVAFDVSFDVSNGPRAARHVARLLRAWPPLRPLVLALKVFLHQRELNEVYTGGIGSYALIVMAASALQLHASRRSGAGGGAAGAASGGRRPGSGGGKGASAPPPPPLDCNLGVLLIDFFRLYGRTLNVERVGITCDEGGAFLAKATAGKPALLAAAAQQAALGRGSGGGAGGPSSGGSHGGHAISTHLGADWRVPDRPFLLAVRDPLDPGNDVARNSWNVQRVRAAFDFAYQALTAPLALPPVGGGGGGAGGRRSGSAKRGAAGAVTDEDQLPESLLGRVIHLQPVLEGRPLPRWTEPGGGGGVGGGGGRAGAAAAAAAGTSTEEDEDEETEERGTPGAAARAARRKAKRKEKKRAAKESAKKSGGGSAGRGGHATPPPKKKSRKTPAKEGGR